MVCQACDAYTAGLLLRFLKTHQARSGRPADTQRSPTGRPDGRPTVSQCSCMFLAFEERKTCTTYVLFCYISETPFLMGYRWATVEATVGRPLGNRWATAGRSCSGGWLEGASAVEFGHSEVKCSKGPCSLRFRIGLQNHMHSRRPRCGDARAIPSGCVSAGSCPHTLAEKRRLENCLQKS